MLGRRDGEMKGRKGMRREEGSDYRKPSDPTTNLEVRNISTMPAPRKLVQPSHKGMPPPPLKAMPPPPPPKFNSSVPVMKVQENNNTLNQSKPENVPDTLIKLMEYGEEDDDPEEITEEPFRGNSNAMATPKPFWAV